MPNNYICALDIGSSKIAATVAQIKGARITNIFFDSLNSKGIKQGEIIDSVGLVHTLSRVLNNLKNKSGIKIKSAYANISGKDIITKHSHAVIPLSERGNKLITKADIEKVNEQARILGSSLEEEIIYSLPLSYSIDSNVDILNPAGLYSHKLGVDLYLVCAKLATLQSLVRVVNQAGLELKDLFFSGIATSRIVFDEESKEGVTILCDIGSDITELLLFKNGQLKEVRILQMGGSGLTEKLSENLSLPFELAEDIKRSYGMVGDYNLIREDKEVLLKKDNLYKPIKQRLVAELVSNKAKEICQILKDTVGEVATCNEINNFIVSGRTILQEGFLESLENTLGVAVKIARINRPEVANLTSNDSNTSGRKYLAYLTCLGVICEVIYKEQSLSAPLPEYPRNPFLKIIRKAKEVYQEYF